MPEPAERKYTVILETTASIDITVTAASREAAEAKALLASTPLPPGRITVHGKHWEVISVEELAG